MEPTEIQSEPIDTAPRDGTVILTELGTMCYVKQSGWWSPVTEGWWPCEPDCQPEMENCEEYGSPQHPKRWVPMPILI